MFPKLAVSMKERAGFSTIMKTPECLQLIKSNDSLSLHCDSFVFTTRKLCSYPGQSLTSQLRSQAGRPPRALPSHSWEHNSHAPLWNPQQTFLEDYTVHPCLLLFGGENRPLSNQSKSEKSELSPRSHSFTVASNSPDQLLSSFHTQQTSGAALELPLSLSSVPRQTSCPTLNLPFSFSEYWPFAHGIRVTR